MSNHFDILRHVGYSVTYVPDPDFEPRIVGQCVYVPADLTEDQAEWYACFVLGAWAGSA